MLTDRSGVDFSDEDSIANALNSLAKKLYYTGYITGERNLTGYVKLAEGLTASYVVKQTGDIAYDKTTGQGSLKDGSVTPNVTYPEEQTKDNLQVRLPANGNRIKSISLLAYCIQIMLFTTSARTEALLLPQVLPSAQVEICSCSLIIRA